MEEYTKTITEDVELVSEPDKGYYEVRSLPRLVACVDDTEYTMYRNKSFHLNRYCFDSGPEIEYFRALLGDDKIIKVYFTGMLTHGQSEFRISYVDPISHTVRNYYPDFLVQKEDGTFTIVEIKADNMIDDVVVEAKAKYARQMAEASNIEYLIVKGSEAAGGFLSK